MQERGTSSIVGGMRGRDAALLFLGGPPEEAGRKVLEVAIVWGDVVLEAVQLAPGTHRLAEGAIVRLADGVAELEAPAGATLRVWPEEGAPHAAGRATLAPGDRARLELGPIAIALRFVREQESHRAGRRADLAFGRTLASVVMAGATLAGMLAVTPRSDEGREDELFAARPRWITPNLAEPPPPAPLPPFRAARPEPAPAPRFAAREESPGGKRGVDAGKRDRDVAKVAGIVSDLFGGASAEVFAPGGLSGGIDAALAGLQGAGTALPGGGLYGLASRGAGPGGVAGAGLGIGGVGTKAGRGRGGGGLLGGGRGKKPTRILAGRTRVVGGLDKSVIGGVVERHWNQIRYCFESELQKSPDLQGKVSLMFTIAGSGAVREVLVHEDTLGDGAVARCMQARVRRWRFPAPKGGGEVVVTYPWVFRAAGE